MQMNDWIKHRETPGTIADVARRTLASEAKYADIERTLQGMYVLEALMQHGGNQVSAAKAIGVTSQTVNRVLRSLKLKARDVRRAAKHLRSEDVNRATQS